ncbi:hypothetical protein [Undibacterium terreum]|uniref:Uncharacterized protein n=1 Tax=Undibacterium terreum TaxID=1224302 RepID=A0A916UJ35_9BURK|nr:hypothetical protein [Undibacterium terreum]GGC75457.1 hypothetical protein GCM10011396_23380 [Undibacterium terreum]
MQKKSFGDYQTDITVFAGALQEMRDAIDVYSFNSDQRRIFERARILKSSFANDKNHSITHFQDMLEYAPYTFEKYWRQTYNCVLNHKHAMEEAIWFLSVLMAWAYMERYWNHRDHQIEAGPISTLVGMHLGLDPALSIPEITEAYKVHQSLFKSLNENSISKKLENSHEALAHSEERISQLTDGYEERLKSALSRFDEMQTLIANAETRATESEEKIAEYAKQLERYKVSFSFLGLTAAFRDFFQRKKKELRNWLGAIFIFGGIAVAIPVWAFCGHFFNSGTAVNQGEALWPRLIFYFPVAAVEILLLYYFRVALTHFNSVQGQMLQLELRMAACGFIEEYAKFAKDNKDGGDLSKFESLIFGGIVADVDKIPSTFDGLDQIISLIKLGKDK